MREQHGIVAVFLILHLTSCVVSSTRIGVPWKTLTFHCFDSTDADRLTRYSVCGNLHSIRGVLEVTVPARVLINMWGCLVVRAIWCRLHTNSKEWIDSAFDCTSKKAAWWGSAPNNKPTLVALLFSKIRSGRSLSLESVESLKTVFHCPTHILPSTGQAKLDIMR